MTRFRFLWLVFVIITTACGQQEPGVLRLATTTSTDNSGLLDALLPAFEAKYGARVDVIAVGTGQALALGEAGDVDIVLVHARAREEAFVLAGHATGRYPVMYNDFVIVGPQADPAGIASSANGAAALAAIAAAENTFASRGDDSGTHTKELALWGTATPAGDWYKELGQGMGDTLRFAHETGAYTLSDRGTFLALQANLPDLVVLFGGMAIGENPDPALFNPYGILPVNPDKEGIDHELALDFVDWLISVAVQEEIASFGIADYGQPLFFPDSIPWRATQ